MRRFTDCVETLACVYGGTHTLSAYVSLSGVSLFPQALG